MHDFFLSCVSREFHNGAGAAFVSYRQELADRLRNAGFHPAVQENFTGGGGDLLKKLEDYIKDCRAVIHLIGDMTGDPAKRDEVQSFLARTPGFLADRSGLRTALGDCQGLSYTQWEALLAIHYHQPLRCYQATGTAPRSPEYAPDPTQRASQQAHVDRLKATGIYPDPFTGHHDLKDQFFEFVSRERLLDNPPVRVNNLPQRSLGELFKGREDFLRDLRATLTGGLHRAAAIRQDAGGQGTRPAAIHALGGVGKTRTAIEYGWHYAQEYDALLFVSAATPQILKDQIGGLCGALVPHLQAQIGTDAEQQYAAALQWLQQHPRWFLILDNVDSDDSQRAATELLAKLSHGHVCITTQIAHWSDAVQPLDLGCLTDEAGADYLLAATQGQRARADDDAAQARALSARLEGLALALEHAGAYIKKLRLSFREYQQKLDASAAKVLAWHDDNQVLYPKSVAETWLITFEKLTPEERELLNVLSWLDPAPVPVWLVEQGGGVFNAASSDQGAGLQTPPPVEPRELLAGLAQWHLITWSDDAQTFKVHRLVQDVTRQQLPDAAAQQRTLDQALDWLDKANLGNNQNPDTWPRWIPAAPHALRLSQHAEQQQNWRPAVRWRNDAALLHQFRGQYVEAMPLFRSALTLAEAHLPPENVLLSIVLSNLASLLNDLGQHQEVEPLILRALVIDENILGPNHPSVAIRLNVLAELLRTTNRLPEAEPLYRRALTILEKTYGPDHPNVARALNNLAVLLYSTNRLPEAEPLYRRALAIDEKTYGPDHPNVARALNNLAVLLYAINCPTEAEPLFRRALAINEKTYGTDHPNVAACLNSLANLLANSERNTEAEPLFRRALAIDEKAFGPDHPNVALRMWGLAGVLHELGRSREALPLIQRAVAILQRHGEQHHYVHPHLDNAQGWLEDIQQATS